MDHLENKYKDLFHNEQLPDDGFDSEGLWNDIAENLEEEKSSDNKILPVFLILLFLGLGLIGFFFLKEKKSNPLQEKVVELENSESTVTENDKTIFTQVETKEEKETAQTAVQQPRIKSEQKEKIAEVKQSILTKQTEQLNTTSIPKVSNKLSSNIRTNFTPLEDASIELLSTTNQIESTLNAINQSDQNVLAGNTILEKSAVEKANTSNNDQTDIAKSLLTKSELIQLPFLPITLMESDINYFADQPILNFVEPPLQKNRKRNSLAWKMDLWGGVNTTKLKYKSENSSDLAALLEQGKKKELALSFGANAALVLKDRWLISSGIEYHQLMVKFEYEDKKNILVPKENQLLTVWLDALTNDTLNTSYGDTTVDAVATREIVNYNKYHKFSIPFEIGFQQKTGKVTYGILTGAVLSFNVFQTGKTLNKGAEITSFDQNSSTRTFKKFDMGFRVSPFIAYHLSEKMTFNIRPQFNWQFNSSFDDTDIKITAQQLNLNFGIGYYFN